MPDRGQARRRPPWWPEGEPFPPQGGWRGRTGWSGGGPRWAGGAGGPPWAEGRGGPRRRFPRRVGLLVALSLGSGSGAGGDISGLLGGGGGFGPVRAGGGGGGPPFGLLILG